MVLGVLWILLLCCLPVVFSQGNGNVTVIIQGSVTVAETDDSFICATIDWWPPEKCIGKDCPWGRASVLNLDLKNPYLSAAIKAFNPLRIRIGGTLQDRITYDVGSSNQDCVPLSVSASGLFGFSTGCLSMQRWDEMNRFLQNTGAIAIFGLNALQGRQQGSEGFWQGPWNSTNARDFIEYTVSKGYPVTSWEFGNELSGHGIGASVDSDQYARDLISLKGILGNLYRNSETKPLLVAPGGFFNDPQWYAELLEASGPNVLDALTHHIYNLGGGDDPHIADRIKDPIYLSGAADTFRAVQHTIEEHGPWSSAWVGEAGGVYNSGSSLVSNTFLNSFWYLDQLGMASKYNTKVYCRQALIGGNYGLLDKETFIPNPDYYSALLWHQLMGTGVLAIDINGSPFLKAYAHCRKSGPGVALLLINYSETTTFNTTVQNDLNIDLTEKGVRKDGSFTRNMKRSVSWIGRKALGGFLTREEYHLTAKDGDYLSRIMLLNGSPLQITESGEIPELRPVFVAVNAPITLAPMSIAFVVFPHFEAHGCDPK
ncbi:heparanase-like protein 2 [Phalaenopsis equestris]|uniref:heparanase-like protein 2 n=1 Tax=Phalaenopsis equestris TaxID=78828 RepID=UPI0009E63652|nr:heparanase-like protein 2 [Phalaenopsis equestris]